MPDLTARVADVVATFRHWLFLPDEKPLLAVLGTVAANRLPGDPVWLLLVSPPGGGKSELLQALMLLPDVHAVATLTEPALLSGTARKERVEGAKGGLLRSVGEFGIIVAKDFGSVLSMHRESRAQVLAALREVYDGAWTRHVGVDGGQKLAWSGKVGLIAGCTPTIDRHHAVMGAMGERFVIYRLPEVESDEQARRALAHAGREKTMRKDLGEKVAELFASDVKQRRELTAEDTRRLVALSTLVVKCRSAVERDSYSREIELVPGSEAPTRLPIALAQLLAGLDAIDIPREQAWEVVTNVALDSMPALRRAVLERLRDANGLPVTTSEVGDAVAHPTQTARRALEDLNAHRILNRYPGGSGKSDSWSLTDWTRQRLNEIDAA